MNKMSPELLSAIEQAESSRARSVAYGANRVEDRRIEVTAVSEERRKGPRRWMEKRALMAARNVEKD